MGKRKKFDWKQPGAQELADSIVHGAAITEGTMVAFPPCFPNVTVPPPLDECLITAMDTGRNGMVYAGTGGAATHLLVGMFHGITGMVFNMGKIEGADRCAAMCCGQKKFMAAVNGPAGSQLISRVQQGMPFDLIQEWHIDRKPFTVIVPPFKDEDIIHAVACADRSMVAGITGKRLFTYDFDTGAVEVIAGLSGAGRLALSTSGTVVGRDENDTLWSFDPLTGELKRRCIPLPEGSWDGTDMMWARHPVSGLLYTVDGAGRIFSTDGASGFSGPLGTIPLAPVGAMAVTNDGRLFVSAGDGIARMFRYTPGAAAVADLGVAVSVIQQRRYGYCFGDAVTGRDGELIFGENDNLGHLWIYFPSIQSCG